MLNGLKKIMLYNKWKDLFTKNDDIPINIQRPLITLMRKYDLGWNDIYYLCSKDEFESFCTSIEEHKKNLINIF